MNLKRLPRARKTSPHAGLEVRLLVEYWSAMQPDEIVTYADMRERTGQDLQRRRDLLRTACHIIETQYGMLFKPVPGIGYQCLGNPDKVHYIETKTRYINYSAHRNLQRSTTVDMAVLSPIDQGRAMTQETINAATYLYTHEATRQALAHKTPPPALTPFDKEAHARLTALWGTG